MESKELHKILDVEGDCDTYLIPPEKSGRILLRLPKSLHARLVEESASEGVSLNQLILSKICIPLHELLESTPR